MSVAKTIPPRAVTVIPPKVSLIQQKQGISAKILVAGYARVSTDTEEQLSSYEAQVDHYTRYIQSNPEWDFVGVYCDEGISATNTKKREGFKRMIRDALDGKINLIVTKSISRFARNTVDTLTTIRELKAKSVGVFFQKENIHTLDAKGELMLTILSSLAQEESHSLSQNVTWGKRKQFADGKVSLPYKQFLGFTKGEDGQPKIVESEAKVVRFIYKLFLEGKTPNAIARLLTKDKTPSPGGKSRWYVGTVISILQNEKYRGSAILQKRFTVDFLNKKMKTNEGEVPQYYVEKSHPAIISPEVFELTQHELKRRRDSGRPQRCDNCFSGRIVCGECGGLYGSKIWHSNDAYRRIIWRCNGLTRGVSACGTKHIYEEPLKRAFLSVVNEMIKNRERLVEDYALLLEMLTDTEELDRKAAALREECAVVAELLRKAVDHNASAALDQEAYQSRYASLAARYEAAKNRLDQIEEEKTERSSRKERISQFLAELAQREELLTEFDEALWCATVETVTIYSDREAVFRFRDGGEAKRCLEGTR